METPNIDALRVKVAEVEERLEREQGALAAATAALTPGTPVPKSLIDAVNDLLKTTKEYKEALEALAEAEGR